MTEKFKNHESFTENEALKEMLKKISYNLEHTKPKYLKREFDDIEGNKEAYEILIKGIKDLIINDGKLDKNDFSTVIFIQIIGKIKGKFEGKRDGKWSPEIDKLIPQIFSSNELNNIKILEPNILNNKKESKEKIKETKIKETQNILELSQIQIKELIQKGEIELQKINKQNEKIKSKVLQIDLILDIAGMYKEYLQSILSSIKFKFASNKDERYENKIKKDIETEIKEKGNIIEFLGLVKNNSELLKININNLLNKLIVSEERISNLGNFDQPFTGNKERTVEGVNKGYEDIKKMLSNPNINTKDLENIRLKIFDKIRSYDGLDDDKHRYNTSEGIRSRITGNVLNNKDLNQDNYIKNSFDLIKIFSDSHKTEFYKSLDLGKEKLKEFLENIKLFDTLGIKNDKQKDKLLENIFNTLKEGKDNIDDNKLKELFINEVNNKIKYLESQNKNDKVNEKIEELKNNLTNINLEKNIQKIKEEAIFKSFERIIISETLNKKQELVKNLSNQNTDIKLYSDIEGIGKFNMSDETFNSISTGTQFLAEQIVVMAFAGYIGSKAVSLVGNGLKLGKTASLLDGGMNLANIGKLSLNTVIDGTAFYLTYTGLDGLFTQKEAKQLFNKINTYDAVRTIFFLGVLRSLGKSREAFNVRNIVLDTKDILLTDIIVRGSLGELLGKEGIKGIDLKNIKNTDFKKIGEFLKEELFYIIPLIVGLRLTDKAFKKIEVTPKENEFIIKIESLQKDIRILKIKRNILKNEGRGVSEIREVNKNLQEKKTEYKKERDTNPEAVKEHNLKKEKGYKIKPLPTQTNNTVSTKDEKKENKKDTNPEDNTNMNAGDPTRYERLKEYSEQAQKGKIDYVLKDDIIGDNLTTFGMKEGKGVGEGLLKKSGFSKDEIKEYNEGKLKSEKAKKTNEKNSLREMEKANEVIYREYLEIKDVILKGKDLDEKFNLSVEIKEKIYLMLKKEIKIN